MFNTGSWPTLKSVVESADSGLELVDSSADSNADPAKCSVGIPVHIPTCTAFASFWQDIPKVNLQGVTIL